jgi:RHS repeat-associated protein
MPGPAPDAATASVPTIHAQGGGGSGGGGGGKKGKKGGGKKRAKKKKGKQGAPGGKKKAKAAPKKKKETKSASDPVDVATGRVFTFEEVEIDLAGPLPLQWSRSYSSSAAIRDCGLGFGWSHSFAWALEVRRRTVVVWTDDGTTVELDALRVGEQVIGDWGWLLRRGATGYVLDIDDGVQRHFAVPPVALRRWPLTALEDRNHNRIEIGRDGERITEVRDSVGRVIRFVPDKDGRIAEVRVEVAPGSEAVLASFQYDNAGDLVLARDADGQSAGYAYQAEHLMVLERYKNGLTFHYRYDEQARCVEVWGDYPSSVDHSLIAGVPTMLADGQTPAKGVHHCRLYYYDDGYTEVADSLQVARYFSNEMGTIDKSVENGRVMTCVYDDDGHLMERSDATGATTVWERDERGRVLAVTDALGRTDRVERDANGLVVKITNAAGGVIVIERDRFGNPLLAIDEVGAGSTYAYESSGLVTELVGSTGGRSRFEYDAHKNLAAVVEADGNRWEYRYDGLGRRIGETDPFGATRTRGYSLGGKPTSLTEHDGATVRFEYDGEGNLRRFIDAEGGTEEHYWGGFNRLVAVRNPNGGVTRYGYDREGQLREVVDEAGARSQLDYDPAGKLVRVTSFDGRVLTYDYEPRERIRRAGLGGPGHLDVVHAPTGGPASVTYPDGSLEEFEYDIMGRLAVARNASAEVRFTRDPRGKVVRESQTVAGAEHVVENDYDVLGMVVARRTSLGHAEAIGRDVFGARVRTDLGGGEVVEHTVDARGREVARQLAGGARIESRYDLVGMLLDRTVRVPAVPRAPGEPEWVGLHEPGVAARSTYVFDKNRELRARDTGLRSARYAYDPAGQLLEVIRDRAAATVRGFTPGAVPAAAMVPELPSERFAYDPAGNVYEADGPGASRAYDIGNRLVRHGAEQLFWDDEGRLMEKRVPSGTGELDVWRYHYNGRGQLELVECPGEMRVAFAYDALARRVMKRVQVPLRPGALPVEVSRTRFVWDAEVLVHEITERASAAGDPVISQRTYCFEDERMAPMAHAEQVTDVAGNVALRWAHYCNDAVGTPERLVSGAGEVLCELDRAAFGRMVRGQAAVSDTPIRFQGQYFDEETGLCWNWHRYYDPGTGRFLTQDPLFLSSGGSNFYAFGLNPVGWCDPFGLDWNYRLRNANGEVYYHGRAATGATPAAVMLRHSKNEGTSGPRLGPGDTLERINKDVTRDEAMGIEHVGIKKGGTNKCPRRKPGEKKGTTPVRGNTDEGIGAEKLKTPVGQSRKAAGEAKLNGQDPNTMPAEDRWQRRDGEPVQVNAAGDVI